MTRVSGNDMAGEVTRTGLGPSAEGGKTYGVKVNVDAMASIPEPTSRCVVTHQT